MCMYIVMCFLLRRVNIKGNKKQYSGLIGHNFPNSIITIGIHSNSIMQTTRARVVNN